MKKQNTEDIELLKQKEELAALTRQLDQMIFDLLLPKIIEKVGDKPEDIKSYIHASFGKRKAARYLSVFESRSRTGTVANS